MKSENQISFDFLKRISILIITLVTFLCASLIFYSVKVVPAMHTRENIALYTKDGNLKSKAIEPLKNGDILEQDFLCEGNLINSFSIKFATYNKVNHGNINVSLFDITSNQEIYSKQFNMSDFKDNEYHKFVLDNDVLGVQGHKLKITINVLNVSDGDEFSLWESSKDSYKDGTLYFNKEVRQSDLNFKAFGEENIFVGTFYKIIIAILLLFIAVMYYLLFFKKLKIENLFLIFTIAFGLVYMFIFPPSSVPDEVLHIFTSYRHSNKLMGYGFGISEELWKIRIDDKLNLKYFSPNTSIDNYRYIFNNLFKFCHDGNLEYIETSYCGNYFQYIFSSLGITLARIFNFGLVPLLYMGRVFNFAFYTTLTYFSIKKIPFGKMILFSVSAFPMTTILSMSFSYDCVIIALSFFVIAQCLYLAYSKERITLINIISLCIVGGLLVASKAGLYIFICLLFLIIPAKRFRGNSRYIFTLLSFLGTCVVVFLLLNVVKISSVDIQPKDIETYSLASLFNGKKNFINMFIESNANLGDKYFVTMFGGHLGWLNINIPFIIILPFCIVAFLSSFKYEKENLFLGVKEKTIMLFICTAIFGAFFVVAYTWTSVKLNFIEGVQGRYFLPMLPIGLLLFRNNSLVYKRNINNILIYVLTLSQCFVVIFAFLMIISGKNIPRTIY